MPESDPPSSRPVGAPSYEPRNLPVPVPPARNGGDNWFIRALRALFGWKPNIARADLQDVLDAVGPGDSGFTPDESRMLRNILGLRERRVGDVMVPRADIIAVQQDIKLGELMRVFEGAGHSRLVVYNDTLDDPVGMVHIRDLIAFMTARATANPEKNAKRKKPLPAGLDLKAINLGTPLSATKIVREILFVPPSMRVIDLLARMQATRIHLSLVVDEYGGTDGLASIEDIVEQIVGDIADEHDEDATPEITQLPDGSFVADARAKIEDVVATVGNDFDVGDAIDDVDTIGGYLVTRAGRLPVRGEIVPGPDLFEFEVLDADPRRVKRVRITRLKERRERPREARKRNEADGMFSSVATSRRRPMTSHPAATPVRPACASRDHYPSRPRRRARHWLAARKHCIRCRRRVGFGHAAHQRMACPVRDIADLGLARGRIHRWTLERRNHRRGGRLVFWFRIFPRGTLLGRIRLSRRRQDLRLAFACRRCRTTRLFSALHGPWTCDRPADLGARARTNPGVRRRDDRRRMATRPPAQRVSLEYVWLRAD